MPKKKEKEAAAPKAEPKETWADVLKSLVCDTKLLEVVNGVAQDLFDVSRGVDPNLKYQSWRELDKAFEKIKTTGTIERIANAVAKFVFDAVIMNWKKRL